MYRFLFVIIFLFPLLVYSQVKTIGLPNIINYPKSEYGASTQNWDITQDNDGIMYFANNDGLLCYDGTRWTLTQISTSSPLRSVFADSRNNLYVGLINDFGIIIREEPNAPYFKSLKDLLPEENEDFDDIWRIHETSEGIVFQCYKFLFLYADNEIKTIRPQNSFYTSFQLDNRLFVQEPGIGVFEVIEGETTKLPHWEGHKEKNVRTILEISDNKILIGSETDGFFILDDETVQKWDTPVNDFVIKNRLYCASSLPGNYYAFGTILNGLVIADEKGNIVKILNIKTGITNNTVLSSFVDRDGDLWLGLDNGIDYIELNSPLSFIGSKNLGSGYCCIVFNDNLYLGTNQGLYVQRFNKDDENNGFELVKNTAGQVWSLDEFDGKLICGHNLGTFMVEGNVARKISNREGAWKYIKLKKNNNFLIGGHYNGLVLLKKVKNSWTYDKKLDGFEESSRYIYQDENEDIWIGHGGKGIFRLKLNDNLESISNVTYYTEKNGLPSNTGNILLPFNSKIFVSTNEGIYKFDESSGTFLPTDELNNMFGECGRIKTIVTDSTGDAWYIAENESGVVRRNEDMTYTKINAPFKSLNEAFINEFEFIYPYDRKNIFLGVEDGFVHYSPVQSKSYDQPFSVYISKVELPYLDSAIFVQGNNQVEEYIFPFRKNAFRFHYSAPFFKNVIPLNFSFFLEGFSENWSDWSVDTYKDFTTLHEGNYTLKLKAKNIYGVESQPASFSFVISPPWHRSNTAYAIYFLFLILVAFLVTKYVLYRIKQSKLKEERRHQQEIREQEEQFKREALIAEKQIIKLRNDKLRAEMIHRDKELANQTMNLIQKNRFLNKLNDELQRLQNSTSDSAVITKLVLITKRIKKELDDKQQQQLFETYFEEVHLEFFKRLKEKFTHLSPNDLKLCAYIRMNISTKEIATLLNISYRGVEISRYRLRKKLELSRDVNLSTYLLNI